MTTKVTFHEFMRAGHIQRWHVVNTVKQQTVAEHAYLVTIIAMELFSRIVGMADPAEVNQLMAAALFHDAPEIRYGDIPTPGKNHIKNRAGESFFDDMDKELMPEIPYVGGALTPRAIPCLKLADSIEALNWITANKAGPQADMVQKACAADLQRLVTFYSKSDTDYYEPVNKILMALGLPYIYREAKEQPL